jgi:Putative MetA-pathway of phenol degradation
MRQVEGGYTFQRTDDERTHSVGELLVRVPASARSELRLGLNSYTVTTVAGERAEGLEDVSLGAKLALLDAPEGHGSRRPATSVIAMTTVPTGARAFREDVVQPELKLVLAWDVTPRVALGANANWAYASRDGARAHAAAGSVTLGVDVFERVGSYAEYFALAEQRARGAGYLNAGLTYRFSDGLQADARAGVGLARVAPDYFVGVGLVRRW